MAIVGDRVQIASSKVGREPRVGIVTAVVGTLLTVRWDTGEESRFIPGPGSISVVGAPAGKKASAAKRAPATKKAAGAKKAPAKKTAGVKMAPPAKKVAPAKKAPAAKKVAPAAKKVAPAKKAAGAKEAPKKAR